MSPWQALWRALVSRYGREAAYARLNALKDGSDADLIAWRSLGKPKRASA